MTARPKPFSWHNKKNVKRKNGMQITTYFTFFKEICCYALGIENTTKM